MRDETLCVATTSLIRKNMGEGQPASNYMWSHCVFINQPRQEEERRKGLERGRESHLKTEGTQEGRRRREGEERDREAEEEEVKDFFNSREPKGKERETMTDRECLAAKCSQGISL